MGSLVGKFFVHTGAEYSHSGEVIEEVLPGAYLVKLDSSNPKYPGDGCHLIAADDMMKDLDLGGDLDYVGWEFFSSREQLDAYTTWLHSSPVEDRRANVVSIVKK